MSIIKKNNINTDLSSYVIWEIMWKSETRTGAPQRRKRVLAKAGELRGRRRDPGSAGGGRRKHRGRCAACGRRGRRLCARVVSRSRSLRRVWCRSHSRALRGVMVSVILLRVMLQSWWLALEGEEGCASIGKGGGRWQKICERT